MDNREQLRRSTELTEQIAGLPKGYLSKKNIGGKVYYYHQWSENGVNVEFYDTETLRIVHVITEDSSTFSGFCIFYRCVQTFG